MRYRCYNTSLELCLCLVKTSERYKTVFYRAHFLKHLCANVAALFLFIFVLFTTPFNYKMDKAYKLLCMGLEPGAVGW